MHRGKKVLPFGGKKYRVFSLGFFAQKKFMINVFFSTRLLLRARGVHTHGEYYSIIATKGLFCIERKILLNAGKKSQFFSIIKEIKSP